MNAIVRDSCLFCCLGLAVPSLAQETAIGILAKRTLPGDSATIRFRMKWENRLSSSNLKAMIEDSVARLRKDWEGHGRSAESLIDIEKQLRDHLSIRKREAAIVVSYSSQRFYYSYEPVGGDPRDPQNRKTIVYFNGEKTFRLLDRSARISGKAEFRDIPYFPLIGVRYAGVPVLQETDNTEYFETQKLPYKPDRADVFQPGSSGAKLGSLVPGFAITGKWKGTDVVKALLSIDNKYPHVRIDFDKYELKLGSPLATRCVISQYLLPPDALHASKEVRSRAEFYLEEVTQKYNGFDASQMLRMLRTGDGLAIERGDGKVEHLVMNPKSWETQKHFIEEDGSNPFWSRVAIGGLGSAMVLVTWHAIHTLRRKM